MVSDEVQGPHLVAFTGFSKEFWFYYKQWEHLSREVTWSDFKRSLWRGARVEWDPICSTLGEREWWLGVGWWWWREIEKNCKVCLEAPHCVMDWVFGVKEGKVLIRVSWFLPCAIYWNVEACCRSRLGGKYQVPFWCKFEVPFTYQSGNEEQANGQTGLELKGASGLGQQLQSVDI